MTVFPTIILIDKEVHAKSKELKVNKGGILKQKCKEFIQNLASFYGDFFATKEGSAGGEANQKKILPHFNATAVFLVRSFPNVMLFIAFENISIDAMFIGICCLLRYYLYIRR